MLGSSSSMQSGRPPNRSMRMLPGCQLPTRKAGFYLSRALTHLTELIAPFKKPEGKIFHFIFPSGMHNSFFSPSYIPYSPAVPKRLTMIQPATIKTIPAMPTILSFWPNSRAEIIVVTTMPPAHQVAYATPKFILFSAFDRAKKQRIYKATDPNDGHNLVKPAEYLSRVVAIISSVIAAKSKR